ncbi:cell divisionftsk/spoiiie [Kribbella flavida DSM 17836]|uniref:Cell divisionftsk/spoiiie n=1 Tax=Kribbella flavida (strain DSM 17836 / JCM 10339 / NBRC 14399) TaxID=479435 RepID=D2Q1L2_KRIFD|nr:hypothetical protein [Kribbella flavida]ADB32001.1 cell divisionftsk/spoiiie [Kribbella flavida DSM 17836]
MPNDARRLSRRTALRTAALVAGAAALASGCDDEPDRSGTPGASTGPDGSVQAPEPSADPEVVAALTTAATQIQQLALRYSSTSQTFPALRTRLSSGVRSHAAHVAKLKELGGFEPPQPGKLPPLPKASAAALADLASREQRLSVAHATAAAKLTGPPARLLATIAASESQLAAVLTAKKAAS